MVPEDENNHIDIARGVKALDDLGVGVHLGAHGQREGLGAHWEMWMMAQGGMSPMRVLHAATLSGAKYLGLDKDLGSIEPGKLADIIAETAVTTITERGATRMDDQTSEASMERRKKQGYF